MSSSSRIFLSHRPLRRARFAAPMLALLCVVRSGRVPTAAAETIHLLAPPPEIGAAEVASHLDDIVVLQGRVESSVAKGGTVVLTLADAPEGVSIVIVPPMVGERPAKIAPRFAGQRVRALGKVREFEGHYEIFVRDPERVEVLDESGAVVAAEEPPRATAAARAPQPAAAPAVAERVPAATQPVAAPGPATGDAAARAIVASPATIGAAPATMAASAAADAPSGAPARGVAAAPAAEPEIVQAAAPVPVPAAPTAAPAPAVKRAAVATPDSGAECRGARADWQAAAVAARAPLDGLKECLAGGQPPCAADLAAVRSTLAELAAHEQRIAWLCGAAH